MSHYVSKVTKYPQSTLQNYTSINEFGDLSENPTLGGILSDSKHSWLAKGPCLEVRNNKTGCKIGGWTFGYILKDSSTQVVCVDEIKKPYSRLPLLAVGLDCAISGGLICIFEIGGSKVIRTIQVKEKITSLHVVDAGFDDLNLRGPLRNFDGILAIGTKHGNVYLIDICRQICEEALQKIDSSVVRDELFPCHLMILSPKDISRIEYYKEASVREGSHLAVHLNVVTESKTEHFTLRGQNGEDRLHVNKEEVTASSLFYCSQLTSLLVGYNFGAFQLWNLSDLSLVYTSPVCEEHMPITHFSIQEPDDDPRAYCYVWVVYSADEMYQSGLPIAVMYSFCYENKDYQEGYGYLYQDFQYCGVRFQVELNAVDETKTRSKPKGGYCIGLQSLQHKSYNNEEHATANPIDKPALTIIYWNVWFDNKEMHTNKIVFDLNQWYRAEMPSAPKLRLGCSNYMTKMNLTDLLKKSEKIGVFLTCKIDNRSLRQFVGIQRLEEHFYPTALNYDIVCLRETEVVHVHCEGFQKALLAQVETEGPLCLLRPAEIFQQILLLGLTPLYVDVQLNIPVSTEIQREVVLNVALENHLIGWLCRCAFEWANGSFSSAGCSLESLINWAFQRAVLLKTNCDKFCAPLFDYSQTRLDNNTCTLLNNCIRQINYLCTFYSYIITKLSKFVSNIEVVTEQHRCLQTISVYFEVLQWLVNVGLLPECPPSSYPRPDERERISAPYPVQQLTAYYTEKRALLQLMNERTFANNDSPLFVDNLITHVCGAENLQRYWQEDGGSGLYPPPSLQSLLRTYLIDGPDIGHKHSLVLYVFLDLAMSLEQEKYDSVITYLIKFPAVFKVSPSLIKITQAFWQLDHGDYTTAMEQLLDPFVLNDDLQKWHHTVAIRSLVLQKQHHFALLYMQVRKPPIIDEQDMFTAISLFIANNMLDEAFYFQKQHQNKNNENLLMHLFKECSKHETLTSLLYRCLDTAEEKAFFKYLQTIRNPSSDDLQVFYYLLRSRFVEAFDTHENSKRIKPETQGLVGQSNASRTDNIVKIFKNLLPDVYKNVVDVVRKERSNLWKEVDKPTPLSVFVHNANEHVQYKSSFIHAALAKAKQTFNQPGNSSIHRELTTEGTPFLRTPRALPSYPKRQSYLIDPKVIEDNGEPSPAKKMKLSPRGSKTSPLISVGNMFQNKMTTPLIKRKISDADKYQDMSISTPQSILKVKHSELGDVTMDLIRDKSGLRITPRKSLPRTPTVRFDQACYTTVLDDSTESRPNISPRLNKYSSRSSANLFKDSLLQESVSSSSKDGSSEVFYSPDASLDNSKSEENKTTDESAINIDNDKPEENSFERKVNDMVIDNLNESGGSAEILSPRARRSYKKSYGERTPVRSSPRVKHSSIQSEKSIIVITSEPKENLNDVPKVTPKVRGRRSLSRQVLESNASKLLTPKITIQRSVTKEVSSTTKQISVTKITKPDSTVVSSNESVVESVSNIEASSSDYDLSDLSGVGNFNTSNVSDASSICPVLSDSIRKLIENIGKTPKTKQELEKEELIKESTEKGLQESEFAPQKLATVFNEESTEKPDLQEPDPTGLNKESDEQEQNDDQQAELDFDIYENMDVDEPNEEYVLDNVDSEEVKPTDEDPNQSYGERTPVRSSPRVKHSSIQSESESKENLSDITKVTPKVRGRRSLSRQVLESNASKLLTPKITIQRSVTKEVSSTTKQISVTKITEPDSTVVSNNESVVKSGRKSVSNLEESSSDYDLSDLSGVGNFNTSNVSDASSICPVLSDSIRKLIENIGKTPATKQELEKKDLIKESTEKGLQKSEFAPQKLATVFNKESTEKSDLQEPDLTDLNKESDGQEPELKPDLCTERTEMALQNVLSVPDDLTVNIKSSKSFDDDLSGDSSDLSGIGNLNSTNASDASIPVLSDSIRKLIDNLGKTSKTKQELETDDLIKKSTEKDLQESEFRSQKLATMFNEESTENMDVDEPNEEYVQDNVDSEEVKPVNEHSNKFKQGEVEEASQSSSTKPNEEIIEIGSSSEETEKSSDTCQYSDDSSAYDAGTLNISFIKNINSSFEESVSPSVVTEGDSESNDYFNVAKTGEDIALDIGAEEIEKIDQCTNATRYKMNIMPENAQSSSNTEVGSQQTTSRRASGQRRHSSVESSVTGSEVNPSETVQKSPSRQKRQSSVEPSVRRITRRSSLLLSDASETGNNDSETVDPDVSHTQGRRSGRAKTPPRKSTRRLSQSSLNNENEHSATNTPITKRNLRTRSASVDQVLETEVRRRTLRSSSVDHRIEEPSKADSDVSTVVLPITPAKIASKRSTRRSLSVEQIDPINLLDKPTFEGEPDPDEAKVYDESPPRSKPARRTSRSVSACSDVSQSDSGIKARLRRQSTDSNVTDRSDKPSPPKKNKTNISSAVSDAGSVRSTRSRSVSTVVTETDITDSPRRSSRVRKSVVFKTGLPEISEENPNENVEEKGKGRKRGRLPKEQNH